MARVVDETKDGWTITYTIGEDTDGVHVITGLNIKPTGTVPTGGLSATRFRDFPMGGRVVARTYPEPTDALRDVGGRPRRGRSHDPRFLAEVSRLYTTVLKTGTRDLYGTLAAELTRRGYPYKPDGARELVRKAHQQGLLTATTQGRVGRMLTPAAISLLETKP